MVRKKHVFWRFYGQFSGLTCDTFSPPMVEIYFFFFVTMKHHFTAHTTRWYNCDPVSSTGYTVLSRIESERTHTTIGPHQMTLFQHTPNRTGTGPNSSQTPTRTYHDGVCHWKPPQMTHQVGGRGSPAPRNQQKKRLPAFPFLLRVAFAELPVVDS